MPKNKPDDDAAEDTAPPPGPAATGDTEPQWEPIDPLTAKDIAALRNERKGDRTRWNSSLGRKHYQEPAEQPEHYRP